MSSDPIEVLRELPELWRESAIGWDKLESGQDASRWLRTCADELESALASLSAPKPPPMNDNAVAVNESAPVNDKPESAEAVFNCPTCPVSVQGRWREPECPECGERCFVDPTAAPAPPRPEASESEPVWSRTKPTHPGVYGVRGFNLGREPEDQFEAIVSVRLVDGELLCNLHESTSEDDFERWSRVVEDNSDSFEWCEFVPATAPQQASAPVGVEE